MELSFLRLLHRITISDHNLDLRRIWFSLFYGSLSLDLGFICFWSRSALVCINRNRNPNLSQYSVLVTISYKERSQDLLLRSESLGATVTSEWLIGKISSPIGLGKEDQKCRLLDITGQNRVVAEGRWSSNDPNQTVHCIPLGPNAVRVWVDVVKVHDAAVWRPSSAIECMEDAFGTTIAWPEDKVVII